MLGFNFTSYNSLLLLLWVAVIGIHHLIVMFPFFSLKRGACGPNSSRDESLPGHDSFYLLFEGN